MTKVPLIPFKRPVPQVLLRPSTSAAQPGKQQTKKESMSKKHKFQAKNVEDVTKKPKAIRRLWEVLSKMDPSGDLWVNDKGIVVIAGDGPKERTLDALKFDGQEKSLLSEYGIYDSPEPDNAETAKGVILTVYQLLELAYAMGAEDQANEATSALTSAADGDGDETETFDEEMPVVSEDDEDADINEDEESEDDEDDEDTEDEENE